MPTEICRHIKTNGLRCGSPALTAEVFCYFHKDLHHRHRRHGTTSTDISPATLHPMRADIRGGQLEPLIAQYYAPEPQTLDLPPLEDRESIQVAISMLVTALAANRVDPKRASMLLYGLQVASSNCTHLDLLPSRSRLVRETVLAPSGEQIAPDEDPEAEIDYQNFLTAMQQAHDEDCECEDCDLLDD